MNTTSFWGLENLIQPVMNDMKQAKSVLPYDITCGEKVRYGYYSALEFVFRRFISQLESDFFDRFNLTLDFDFEIQSGTKFNRYIDRIRQPVPIFVFHLTPLIGDCLLVMDNRSANLMLAPQRFSRRTTAAISDKFQLNSNNYNSLSQSMDRILSGFYQCWETIFQAEGKLKKLVANRIKAKIMEPVELCVIVTVTMRQKTFSTCWEFCFSDYQLDQVIKQHGNKVLLAGNGEVKQTPSIQSRLRHRLISETSYELKGVLGELNISPAELNAYFQQDRVIPLKNEIRDNVIVYINDTPAFAAHAGVTFDRLSLQISDRYERIKTQYKERQKPFTRLTFPQVSS